MGASWDDVLRIYGKTDLSAPDMQPTFLMGWDFSFRNKRLVAMHVARPLIRENDGNRNPHTCWAT